jgi:hypothetical protein
MMLDVLMSEGRATVRKTIGNVPVYPIQEFLCTILPFGAQTVVTSIFMALEGPAVVHARFGEEPRDSRL